MSGNRKKKDTLIGAGSRDENGHSKDSDETANDVPDWRLEMRQEIRSAIAEMRSEVPLQLPLGPSEIDAADVILESEPFVDVMRRIESGGRANKTAIRLAGITKEGNKQHFMDMVEIREEVEKAQFSLKESIVLLFEEMKKKKKVSFCIESLSISGYWF